MFRSQSALAENQWLMYIDADTYIIDPKRSVESIVLAAHKMQKQRITAGQEVGSGCDLIVQEDGATSDPGANMGWFLLRNTEWARALLRKWKTTRSDRNGDYVQVIEP